MLFWLAASLALVPVHQSVHRASIYSAQGAVRHTLPLALAAKAKKPSKKAGGATSGGGFGKVPASAVAAAPSAAELLKRSIEVYNEIQRDQRLIRSSDDEDSDSADDSSSGKTPEYSVTEYVVTVRLVDCVSEAADAFGDWVPVCLINLKSSRSADMRQLVPQAIGASVKEILEAGCSSTSILRKAPRTNIQYAYEPLDSYNTHIFDGLFSRGERKAKALAELDVENGASPADVKKAHRKLMLTLHPDRFVGDEAGAAAANERMIRVQRAYEELGGGKGSATSGYAAIGGKGRVDFSGPVSRDLLGPLGKTRGAQQMPIELQGWRCGVYPLEPAVCQEFTLRNIMAAK
jgi:DnaJ-domain-containing protein 1